MNLFTLFAKLGLDTSEYEKGLTQAKKSMTDYRRDVATLAQTFKKQGMSMSDAMKKAYAEIDKSLYDFTAKSEKAAAKSSKHWSLFGKSVEKSGTEAFERLSAAAIAKATAIGHIIADITRRVASAVVNLGKSSLQASADIEAEVALYEQVFGELESAAGGVLESISKDTNILATRLRGIGTSAFMQFKGAGVDAASALSAMDKYTRLAADAAAAYNMSIEDADVRLRSFLRGNTEAGDSIGLFTSESQRNERAIATYGQKWLDLTEAQKQMLMLNVVDEIYTQQQVLGQAAREGHEWENVIGNLNKAFTNLQGTVGGPFREKLIPVIEELTKLLNDETFILRVGMLAAGLGDIADDVFTGVIDFIDQLLKWSNGESNSSIVDDIVGIATGLGDIAGKTFKGAIDLLSWLIGGESASDGVSEALSDLNTLVNSEGFQNAAAVVAGLAIAWAALNVPLLVVGGVLATIAGNWDDIKTACQRAWTEISNFCQQTFVDPISDILSNISGFFWGIADAAEAAALAVRKFFGIEATGDPTSPTNPYGANFHGAATVGENSNSPYSSNYHVSNGKGAFENIKSGLKSLIGLDTGLDYVPFDNYLARLHEGEAVLTKAEATNWRRGEATGTVDTAGIASAVAAAVREALDGVGVYMGAERVGDLVTERVSRNIAKNTWNRRYQTT